MKIFIMLSIVVLGVAVGFAEKGFCEPASDTNNVANFPGVQLQTLSRTPDTDVSAEPRDRILSLAAIPGPSPLLLFAMGFLGVGCVIVNERRLRK